MSVKDSEGVKPEKSNKCHICYRQMDNVKGRVIFLSDGKEEVMKGAGTCPEHGVSYTALSVSPGERGSCKCEKSGCPVCSKTD